MQTVHARCGVMGLESEGTDSTGKMKLERNWAWAHSLHCQDLGLPLDENTSTVSRVLLSTILVCVCVCVCWEGAKMEAD